MAGSFFVSRQCHFIPDSQIFKKAGYMFLPDDKHLFLYYNRKQHC